MGKFSIKATNLHWIDGSLDYPNDLCLHGDAVAIIGKHKRQYSDATVSATALYLLKSLTENHYPSEGEEVQMLPCCGFNIYPNEDLTCVSIAGCPNGTDWTIEHDGHDVVITLDNGYVERINIIDYQRAVFDFADFIENFYQKCSPKNINDYDEEDRNGYIAFWNEWHRRRNKTS